jgi:hypothetical protein
MSQILELLSRCGALAAMLLGALGGRALAQPAYFSATGTFTVAQGETHDFRFSIPSTASTTFRTWANGGGTNAAGEIVPAGGIDSIISLFTGAGGLIDFNDDIGPGQRDSRLIFPSLAGGSYRLHLENFKNASGNGSWAVDLLNNSGDITWTSATGSANSIFKRLAFGSGGGSVATLPVDAVVIPLITQDLQINGGGIASITGAGTAIFTGRVTSAPGGGIAVAFNSTARFTNLVSGLGAFSGAGAKIFEANASGGNLATSGSTIVAAGATLTAGHIRETSLTLNGAAVINPNGTDTGTSRVNTLALAGAPGAWTGKLDLTNNAFVIDYTGGSPLNTVLDQIHFAAAHSGTAGLTSSSGSLYAIGYAEASSFSTVPAIFGTVDSTSLLVRGTRKGDATLDGLVNLADFNKLASNFGQTGKAWIDGDFNYDGIANLADFNFIASNFGLTAGADGMVDPEDWSALASAVPEPGSSACAVVLAGIALARRERHRAARGAAGSSLMPDFTGPAR